MPELQLPTNQIHDLLAALSRRRWWVIVPACAGLTAGLVVLDFTPKKYEALTRVEVRDIKFDEMPQENPYKKDIQNVGVQVLATSRLSVALKERLKWPEFLNLTPERERVKMDEVAARTKVERARKERDIGADYVTITYRDESARRAADFANTIRQIWQDETKDSFKDQVKREFDQNRKSLEGAQLRLDAARRAVRSWEEQNSLSPSQAQDRRLTEKEDWKVESYRQALAEKMRLEKEVKIAEENLKAKRARYASEPSEVEVPITDPVAIASDPTLQSVNEFRQKIAVLKMQQVGLRVGNKRYQRLAEQIEALESAEKGFYLPASSSSGGAPRPSIGMRVQINPEKLRLKKEMEDAEESRNGKSIQLREVQADLARLEPESRERSRVYETYNDLQAKQDLADKFYREVKSGCDRKESLLRKIDSAAGDPFRVLDVAVAPEKPVEPNPAIILAAALVVGAGAGLALVLVREYVKSSFRSVEDAISSLPIPVLGSVGRIATLRELRSERKRRVVAVGSSLLVCAMIGSVAAVYLVSPKTLPGPVLSLMDEVKQKLR